MFLNSYLKTLIQTQTQSKLESFFKDQIVYLKTKFT